MHLNTYHNPLTGIPHKSGNKAWDHPKYASHHMPANGRIDVQVSLTPESLKALSSADQGHRIQRLSNPQPIQCLRPSEPCLDDSCQMPTSKMMTACAKT
ncbi:predicted protein [Lichtheimia corymbifera JMRC:FSU:9682]|uniref:Uncharacterized protein n=1 Tax=Lichtheimia corymbifera JMRC:FSU:9682 TaxID=1263082 RepID=A0A068SAE4_9FUNG|nr:predicted protein [Lichtheimia corymbifera JMRC:FSU:9682]